MDWGLMHCVKRIFGKKMFLAEKMHFFVEARELDSEMEAQEVDFEKMLKMTKWLQIGSRTQNDLLINTLE